MKRREWWSHAAGRLAMFAASIQVLGVRFHAYQVPNGMYRGWITCWGRVVAFVPDKGTLFWWLK